jgi:hypothetical protein
LVDFAKREKKGEEKKKKLGSLSEIHLNFEKFTNWSKWW